MRSEVVTDVLAMAAADTEYSYEFPQNTRGFRLKLRATDQPLRISSVSGMVAVPGVNYNTLPAGKELEVKDVKMNDQVLYFAADVVSQVVEIIYWTGIDRAS